jgi:hypothetical protein
MSKHVYEPTGSFCGSQQHTDPQIAFKSSSATESDALGFEFEGALDETAMQHQAVLKIDLCHLISTLPGKGTYLLFEMAPSRAILILFMLE